MSSREEKRARLRRIDDALTDAFGPPPQLRRGDALDELVRTILSQNTSDANSSRAYAALREAFPHWEDVLRASEEQLERVLRPGGLARTKSRAIIRMLGELQSNGALGLDYLEALDDESAEAELLRFPGVGRKTARCVLLFSLGRDVCPMDTHVQRVLRRLEIVPEDLSPDKAHTLLDECMPAGQAYSLHVQLIRLGRRICRARRPMCGECPLCDDCPFP